LPVAAFVPGGLIKSSDNNTINNDLATALTQSLATTGVSTMTGQLVGSAGLVTAPGYTFSGAPKTGFYLAGANQIGWASNGVQGATFNSDTSTTWAGAATFGGTITATKGTIPIGGVMDFGGSAAPAGWLLCTGQQVSTITYAALFAVLGTTYGSGAGTFGIPDYRGRSGFGQDSGGSGRITIAGGNFDGTILGNVGGAQGSTLFTANLPPYTPSISFLNTVINGGSGNQGLQSGTGGPVNIGGSGSGGTNVALSATTTLTIAPQGGTSTIFTNLPPAIIINKIMYAGI
jgi:microcystin-dependent protein